AQPVSPARGHYLQFNRALEEMIVALLGDQTHEVARFGRLVSLRDMPAGKVGTRDIEDLSLTHQLLHPLPNLLPGRAARDVMHLIDIDVVGLQPAEAGFALALERERVHPTLIRPLTHLAVNLGRQDRPLPASASLVKPSPDDLLGYSDLAHPKHLSVAVRRIKEVDPALVRAVHDSETSRLAGMRTKVHRAQTKTAHLQASPAQSC